LLTGFLAVPVTFLLQFGGLSRTTVSSAALLVGALPLLLALGASWFFCERLSRVGWTAVGLSSLGIVLLVGLPGRGHDWLGDLLVFLSLITAAAWVLLNKRLLRSYSPLVATAYILAFGTSMLVPISLWWDGTPPTDLSAGVWYSVLGLGLAGTAFAFTLWNWGLEHWEASRAGVFLNLEPVIGAALGVTILGETLGPGALLGGVLVVCSAIVISLPLSSAQPQQSPNTRTGARPLWPVHRLAEKAFQLDPGVRWVAVVRPGQPSHSIYREGIDSLNSSATDEAEEKLVNRTLLRLAGARGDWDLGGLQFVARWASPWTLGVSVRDWLAWRLRPIDSIPKAKQVPVVKEWDKNQSNQTGRGKEKPSGNRAPPRSPRQDRSYRQHRRQDSRHQRNEEQRRHHWRHSIQITISIPSRPEMAESDQKNQIQGAYQDHQQIGRTEPAILSPAQLPGPPHPQQIENYSQDAHREECRRKELR
jgi:drug/metabolite transporter (DMT)-like permease